MSDFNFNKYLKNNPLLKETNGYGNFIDPRLDKSYVPNLDYISREKYDNMTDDEIDAAELAGSLEPRDKPLGPDGELMEGANGFLINYYSNSEPTVKQVAQEIDGMLSTLNIPDVNLEQLADLIISLGDAYAEERVENYRADTLY